MNPNPQIAGIHGLMTPTNNVLIAAFGNDMVNLGTGKGYGVNLTPGYNVEFEDLVGCMFFVNGIDQMKSFDGNIWSNKNCQFPPLGNIVRVWRSHGTMYVGNISLMGTQYPSRVWFSALPSNNIIQWGFMQGTNLQTFAGNQSVAAANAGFLTYGLQRGDPITILTGNDIGQYLIQSVDADQQLTLTTPLTTTATGISYWAGGNWFDVGPDDGDFLVWMEINNDYLMCFKRDSLYRINILDGSNQNQIRGAYGTTSGRSVQNLHELTIYYHSDIALANGFYAFNGGYSQKISAPIDNHIAGIASGATPIAWVEGELYRCFVGDILNLPKGINVSNAVMTWDYASKTWSVDPIDDIPVCSTWFRQALTKQAFFGTQGSFVMVTPQGSTYNGSPIPFNAETGVIFPFGPTWIGSFYRMQIFHRNMKGTAVQYKRAYTPFEIDRDWTDLGMLDRDRTELQFHIGSNQNQMSGIKVRFINMNVNNPEGYIEKITFICKPKTTVLSQGT